MKKYISRLFVFALFVILLGSNAEFTNAATSGIKAFVPPIIFPDVLLSDIYYDAVLTVWANGVMIGYPDGYFRPWNQMSRRQAAIVFAKLAGLNYASTPLAQHFSDVPPSDPEYKYIEAIYSSGITFGCSTNPLKFCPNDGITREQFAMMLGRALHYDTIVASNTSYFTDVPASALGFHSIQVMKEKGITVGCTTTTYCPNVPIYRAQAAMMLGVVLR